MCGRAGHIQPALTRQKEERPRRGSQAGWRKGSSYLGSLIECEIHKEIPKGLSFRLEFLERKHPFCTISQYISTYVDDFFQRTPDAAVLSVVIIIFNSTCVCCRESFHVHPGKLQDFVTGRYCTARAQTELLPQRKDVHVNTAATGSPFVCYLPGYLLLYSQTQRFTYILTKKNEAVSE